ncbi:hypothetical protein Q5H93_06155 [Hymenobacter sp. ASUV-10]|uniref:RepB family plasmid replication initiator protein n=1 Tax=Hymenobacter aranciens TaxID=3063996 RepID=A0ABT9B7X8_9BACT|nr:hypothetical protein [Hymenobacter sp. ASUV-10]MDO7874308.1 hypothetical protein [Hymenobacter sp. ASUV-10]
MKIKNRATRSSSKARYAAQRKRAKSIKVVDATDKVERQFRRDYATLTIHQRQLLYFALEAIKHRQGETDEAYEDTFFNLVQWAVKRDFQSNAELTKAMGADKQHQFDLINGLNYYQQRVVNLSFDIEKLHNESYDDDVRKTWDDAECYTLRLKADQLEVTLRLLELYRNGATETEIQQAAVEALFDLPKPSRRLISRDEALDMLGY